MTIESVARARQGSVEDDWPVLGWMRGTCKRSIVDFIHLRLAIIMTLARTSQDRGLHLPEKQGP